MLHTFQVAETGEQLPRWQQSGIYDYDTFDKLLGMLPANKNEIFRKAKLLEARVVKMETRGIHVPGDCKTLRDAVALVEWNTVRGKYANYTNKETLFRIPLFGSTLYRPARFSTIVMGKGNHQIAGDYLRIASAMNIVGDPGVPKNEIVVEGGIYFKEGIPGNCHLQHLTLRQAEECGVYAFSCFTMKDVLVEQCGYHGVWASGTGVVGRCTNMEVRECGWSGVVASNGGSITLIGAKTKVHHNCTKGDSDFMGLKVFGLKVFGASSTIQLVSPLTKEQVALDNSGGGNWGANWSANINQIKTMVSQ